MSAARPSAGAGDPVGGAAPALHAVANAVLALAPWRQFLCRACGWIYDEALGDPDSGLAPGTRFEDIPEDWACPLCGVTKSDFEPQERTGVPAPVAACLAAAPVRPRGAAGVVIVGGGTAGWEVVHALRERDARLPITLVTACPGDRYDKPLLSVALARGLDPDALVKETGAAAARRLGVRLLADTHAVRICRDTRQLRTTRGTLRYEHLVLAHGARAALPPQLPAALCWRVNDLRAYRRLRSALGDAPRDVVVVGAGLVGCELANDLALAGHVVTLLDTQPQPLGRWPAEQAGAPLLRAWAGLPIRFEGGVQVAGVERTGAGRACVNTLDGRRFEADAVVAATGLRTPSRLAAGAGLAWEDGIAVDAHTLRTSDARIHALGDCITVDGQASRFIEPIVRQARTIAADITGGAAVPYEPRAGVVRVKTTSLPLTLH